MNHRAISISMALSSLLTVVALASSEALAQGGAEQLGPSDLAILYPLKPSSEPDAIFPVEGDGFCQTPSLAATPDQPALWSRKEFNALVDRAFGVQAYIEPPAYLAKADDDLPEQLLVRKRHYEQWSDLAAARQQRADQLKAVDDAYRNSDYSEPLFCYQPHLAGGIGDLAEDYQLELGHHLVQSEGVLTRACDYLSWRVVAIRFNPCLEQAEIEGFWQSDRLPAACKTRELRLVAQPVYRTAGRVVIADVAMHLIYNLSLVDMTRLIEAFRQIKTLSLSNSAVKAMPLTLAPHPGLIQDMDRCDGPVAAALRKLLLRFAKAKDLHSVAWMSSSASQSRWSFGAVTPQGVAPRLDPAPRSEDNALTASISLKQMSRKVDRFPFAQKTMQPHELSIAAIFAKPFRNPAAPLREPWQLEQARRLFDDLDALANPHKISQVAQNPHRFSSDCMSCHMLAQSKRALSAAVADEVTGSATALYRNRTGQTAVPWAKLPPRRLTNFRNFGYGPGSSDELLPAISERVSHEALNLADVVARFFSAP